MKYLILGLLLCLASCSTFSRAKDKYFLVGYVADSANIVYDGGDGVVSNHYPKMIELVQFIQKEHNVTKVHILSVIEQTKSEHDQFWKK